MKQTPQEIIDARLKVAAHRHGMIDLDDLALADLSTVKLTEAGEVEGADELMTSLRATKPHLFHKMARDASPAERDAFRKELERGPPPQPMDMSKRAKDLSPAERAAFIREVARRWG